MFVAYIHIYILHIKLVCAVRVMHQHLLGAARPRYGKLCKVKRKLCLFIQGGNPPWPWFVRLVNSVGGGAEVNVLRLLRPRDAGNKGVETLFLLLICMILLIEHRCHSRIYLMQRKIIMVLSFCTWFCIIRNAPTPSVLWLNYKSFQLYRWRVKAYPKFNQIYIITFMISTKFY